MKVAALIITHNRKKLLYDCVKSIKNGSIIPDIIIVDNASNDGTEEYVKENFPESYFIRSETNLGPAGGAELGQRFALNKLYDAVWMLDDDVKVSNNSLENLIEAYTKLKLTSSGKVFLTSVAYGDEELLKPLYNLLRYNCITGLTVRIEENEYRKEMFLYDVGPMHGLFLPRKVLEETGFFNGKFFGWYDDTEFLLRAKKKGFQGFAIVNSKIFHPTIFRKRVKILGKNFTFISGRPIRMYLGTRNNIIAQRNLLPWFNFYFIFFPLFLVRRLISIVLFYDEKIVFAKNFIKGIIDAFKILRRQEW